MKKDKDGAKTGKRLNMLWALLAVTVVLFAVYRLVVMLVDEGKLPGVWYTVIMWTYMACGCALLLAVVILQRGFSNKTLQLTDLDNSMSAEEKTAYIESDTKRKRAAKVLLIPLTAILFVFIFEIIELYYLPTVTDWIKGLSQ